MLLSGAAPGALARRPAVLSGRAPLPDLSRRRLSLPSARASRKRCGAVSGADVSKNISNRHPRCLERRNVKTKTCD
jgi:hypothetical protein